MQKWWRQYRPVKKGQLLGTYQDEITAEKIRDPETYYALWKGDKDYLKHKEEAWKMWREKNSGTEKQRAREASKLVIKKEIKDLERAIVAPSITSEEKQDLEKELQTKRAELARLEAQIDEQKQPTNWTPWTIIISLSALLLVNKKIKKKNKS